MRQNKFIKKKSLTTSNSHIKTVQNTTTNILILLITLSFIFLIGEISTKIPYSKTGQIIAANEYEKHQKELYNQLTNISDQNRFDYGDSKRW